LNYCLGIGIRFGLGFSTGLFFFFDFVMSFIPCIDYCFNLGLQLATNPGLFFKFDLCLLLSLSSGLRFGSCLCLCFILCFFECISSGLCSGPFLRLGSEIFLNSVPCLDFGFQLFFSLGPCLCFCLSLLLGFSGNLEITIFFSFRPRFSRCFFLGFCYSVRSCACYRPKLGFYIYSFLRFLFGEFFCSLFCLYMCF
jgi:hypothetical protein